jgi:hypothetical protein
VKEVWSKKTNKNISNNIYINFFLHTLLRSQISFLKTLGLLKPILPLIAPPVNVKEVVEMTATQPDPSPDEIKERCAEIQSEWSPAERMRRMRHDRRPLGITADGDDTTDEPSRASEAVTGNLEAPDALLESEI